MYTWLAGECIRGEVIDRVKLRPDLWVVLLDVRRVLIESARTPRPGLHDQDYPEDEANCHWQAQDERGRPLAEQRNRERCSQASSCGEVEPPSDYLLKLRLDGPVHRASLPREHRAIQVERVTVSVTPTCHSAGHGATQSAARPRSSRCTALG